MWVLFIGLVVSLQGLLRLGCGEGESVKVSAFSPTGQVRLGGNWPGHEALAHLQNVHEGIAQQQAGVGARQMFTELPAQVTRSLSQTCASFTFLSLLFFPRVLADIHPFIQDSLKAQWA